MAYWRCVPGESHGDKLHAGRLRTNHPELGRIRYEMIGPSCRHRRNRDIFHPFLNAKLSKSLSGTRPWCPREDGRISLMGRTKQRLRRTRSDME